MIETTRRALGVAIQIIEEMPRQHQQISNMMDMRQILTHGSTGYPDRDGYIILQALTLALAWRASTVPPVKGLSVEKAESATVGMNNRREEFRDLFSALALANNPALAGLLFEEACQQVSRVRIKLAPPE